VGKLTRGERLAVSNKRIVLIIVGVLVAFVVVVIGGGLFLARQLARLPGIGLGMKSHAGKPIPCGPEAMTQAKVNEYILGFYRRNLVEAYRQSGKHNPAWDQTAYAFLEQMARLETGYKDQAKPEVTDAQMRKLLAAGCDDPIVLGRIGDLEIGDGKNEQAQPHIAAAIAGLERIKAPALVRALAYHNMAQLTGEVGKQLERADFKWRPRAIEAYVEAADRSNFGPCEQRAVWGRLCQVMEDDFRRSQAQIVMTLKSKPNTDPWILNMAWGKHRFDWAVLAAGGEDYILMATGEKRKTYLEFLGKARTYLEKAYELHPEYPQAASFMIEVSKGAPKAGETERQWFDRAVAAQLDWMPAYHGMVGALNRWWGGSRKAQLAFAKECLDTKRFDTLVPQMYERTVYGFSGRDDESTIWNDPEVWTNLQTFYEGAVAEATRSDPDEVKPLRTRYVISAWRTGHTDVARAQLDATGGAVDRPSFDETWGERADLVVGQIHALTGPNKDAVQLAEQLFRVEKNAEASAAFKPLLGVEKDTHALFYVRDRLQTLQWEQRFRADEWVNLDPTPDLVGWNPWQGNIKALPDGKGFISRPGEQSALMVCNMRPGEYFEVHCDVEFPPQQVKGIEAAFVVNIAAASANPYYDSFRIIRTPPTAYCGGGWSEYREHALGDVPRKFRLRLVQCHNRITLYMNDQTIFQDQELTDPGFRFEGPHSIGFGGETYPDRSQPVIYRNIQIHRVSSGAIKSKAASEQGE